MEEIKFEVLDMSNEVDVLEYERGLYRAFKAKSSDGWISNKYKQIGDDRLQHPTFNYSDQVVYSIKMNGEMIGAGAVNLNSDKEFELVRKGFAIADEDKDCFIADGLNMFAEDGALQADQFVNIFIGFAEYILEDLKKRGVDYWYGTVYKALKAAYLIFGFETVDKKEIDGKKMFLMKYDVKG